MKGKKLIQLGCLLIPAVVVAAACSVGLGSNPIEVAPSQGSVPISADSTVSTHSENTEQPGQEESKISESTELPSTDESMSDNSKTASSVQQSSVQSSKTTSQTSTSSQPTVKEQSQTSTSPKSTQNSVAPKENSQTVKQETSKAPSKTEVSKAQPKAEASQATKPQTSKPQSSKKPTQQQKPQASKPTESSIVQHSEVKQESQEPSVVVTPEPTGKYVDGTYKATVEVDGFAEEGFLYDLEVTVTVSGGEVANISGKIKNDRSEDPESNEAYVRRAVKKLSSTIIAKQDTNGVDAISNATYSSDAILKATATALAQAKR